MVANDLLRAYGSLAFGVQRSEIELLITQAVTGRPIRKDLWCPISSKTEVGSAYRDALTKTRQTKVASASGEAALTAAERKALMEMRAAESGPAHRADLSGEKVIAKRGKPTAEQLIAAAHAFQKSTSKN